jgi:predicted ATPase
MAEHRAPSTEHCPQGTVTFLLTDIEGSTKLWLQHPEAMRLALARHDALLSAGIEAQGGTLLKQRGEGDSCFAVFSRATDAVAAALALQRALAVEPWPSEARLQVRVALHTGEAELRPKSLLLVLDNCEHLLSACAELVEAVLRGCPHVRVLATSREGLGIAGEQTYRVPSLSVPDPKQLPSLEHLQAFEAVSLFADRALLSQPDFALTPANAVAVAQVCHRLDGIPLAIELAAARVKALPIEKIAERLDDIFRLLTGGSRTALPRQQTLRALIDWSYHLLSEPERALLLRLSVFAGGWTLEAAEAVGAGEGVEASEVIVLLTALVEKSLVVYEAREGEARYHLLETVRQYGRNRLLEAGESETVRTRHRDWFLAFAERAEPELVGPAQAEWRERLETEHDNLRAALDWSAEGGGAEAGLRLGGALLLFWQARCHFSEGRQCMARMLALPGSAARTEARAKALYTAGRLATWQDDMEAARSLLQESLGIRRELGDARNVFQSLLGLGAQAHFQSDLQEAYSLFEEAREIAEKSGDKQDREWALRHLGAVLRKRGDLQAARSRIQESLVLLKEIGDRWGTAYALCVLGLVACDEGDMETARPLLRESLTVSGEVGDQRVTAQALLALARVSWHEKDAETARALLDEALAIGHKLGGKRIIAGSLEGLGQMALVQGDMGKAHALFKESLRLSWEVGERLSVVTSLEGLAGLAAAERQPERVAHLFGAAEALRQAIGALRPPLDRAAYDQLTAAVRAALGEDAFAAAWAAGQAMSLEEALNEALKPPVPLNPKDG